MYLEKLPLEESVPHRAMNLSPPPDARGAMVFLRRGVPEGAEVHEPAGP